MHYYPFFYFFLAPALPSVVSDWSRPLPRPRCGAAHSRWRGDRNGGSVCGGSRNGGGGKEEPAGRGVEERSLVLLLVSSSASCCSCYNFPFRGGDQLVVRLDACSCFVNGKKKRREE